ncbi:serine hydrolase domain-containing protein [Paenibacillus thailandensis]|uniref:serine hydrolase domain-containing protein n=1 Tax=Paenibacillus thailandensis TaxID=393250 RepID=UPI0036D36A61
MKDPKILRVKDAMRMCRESGSGFFDRLERYTATVQTQIESSGAALYVMHQGKPCFEWYAGTHGSEPGSRNIDASSMFNVGSIRKTFYGLLVSHALQLGKIRDKDDPIGIYLNGLTDAVARITIRQLLTHTHGLRTDRKAMFPPGTDWHYNNTGVQLIVRLIRELYGLTVAEAAHTYVLEPYGFRDIGWHRCDSPSLVWNDDAYAGIDGSESNLFCSARELARWGQLHLDEGQAEGGGTPAGGGPSATAFKEAVGSITPSGLRDELPRNGFFWFVQDRPRTRSEIGDEVPAGAYQTLGITGCACLVIPELEAVAVRMYNQRGPNPEGYDYLNDIRTFGNIAVECLRKLGTSQAIV